MKNKLLNRYLDFKHKTLVSYAETLYKVYEIEDENLWKDDKELKVITDNILKIYVDKYYLRSKLELKALNVNNLSDKDFKMTLSLAVIADYYGDRYEKIKADYKKSIYNLTLIIYIVTNVDKDISFYNKGVQVRIIIDKINELFGDVLDNHHINKNPFVLDVLANKIKDAERKELRFFETFKDSESYNLFAKYDEGIYFVDYRREFSNLNKYDEVDVKKVYMKYRFKESFMPVLYELASITLLKAFANNCNVPILLLPISNKYLTMKSNINKLKEIFESEHLKKHIKFSVLYNDYKLNYDKFNLLKDYGLDIAIFIPEDEVIVDYSNIKFEHDLYVTDKFIKNNPKFENFIEKAKNKHNYLKDNLDYISEDELITICLKGEN